MNSALLKDGYKIGHPAQYPAGTEMVYSNFTARGSRDPRFAAVILFGLQYVIKKYLIEEWNDKFFHQPKEQVVSEYTDIVNAFLGTEVVTHEHIAALHDLGFLPVRIVALPEGTRVPLRVPMFTIHNTRPEFFWVTNMLETLLSCSLWQACTSATIAAEYRDMVNAFADRTSSLDWFPAYQCHDFSMRGMSSLETAALSGAGHLTSHIGSDTLPARMMLRDYYNANDADGPISVGVPATEHSVMCFDGEAREQETIERLVRDVYPSGIVSLVLDAWDFWKVVTETLPALKKLIMSRDGKLVVRPDSGDPVLILCGDPTAEEGSAEYKGLIQCLWDTFGGSVNDKGFKELDSHIGAIYGDSITLSRAETILRLLEVKGFASTNIVFGIGSYTYQYNTRDTFGFAMKATAGCSNGNEVHISKNPKTDNGLKKSAKGFLGVTNELELVDGLSFRESATFNGPMRTVFINGLLIIDDTLFSIRDRIAKG